MLKKIRSLVSNSNPSFFGIYDNAISKKDCCRLIDKFESRERERGNTVAGYDFDRKSCHQLGCKFSEGNIISSIVRSALFPYLDKYKKQYPSLHSVAPWRYVDYFNFQKYDGEDDGYKIWHCEHDPHKFHTSRRVLAWMFYLNNAKCGTEFKHYPTVQAKMGRLIIWPAFWTHLHRGVLPNKGLKYIITGWASYKHNMEDFE